MDQTHTDQTPATVLYNGSCPICSAEIAAYRRHAADRGLPLDFRDLGTEDLSRWGLTADQAARRLHVDHAGRLLSGLDAFRVLWAAMPRFAWLAWFTGLPVIRPLARLVYDHVAAPALYALHRRRQRRARAAENPVGSGAGGR